MTTKFQKEKVAETTEVMRNVFHDIHDRVAEPFALGHGFMWCFALIEGVRVKILLGGGCAGNWTEIGNEMKKVFPEIEGTWVNLD